MLFQRNKSSHKNGASSITPGVVFKTIKRKMIEDYFLEEKTHPTNRFFKKIIWECSDLRSSTTNCVFILLMIASFFAVTEITLGIAGIIFRIYDLAFSYLPYLISLALL